MAYVQILMIAASVSLAWGQRPFFAGTRPIGYPEVEKPSTTADQLGNRFDEGTTQRLPLEAQGDRDLIDRLSKLPVDKQPFWFINWQALEAHRQQPQTYPIRPNPFAQTTITPDNNSANINSGATGLGNRSGDSITKDKSMSSSSSTPTFAVSFTASTTNTHANTPKSQESDLKSNTSTNKDATEKKAVN